MKKISMIIYYIILFLTFLIFLGCHQENKDNIETTKPKMDYELFNYKRYIGLPVNFFLKDFNKIFGQYFKYHYRERTNSVIEPSLSSKSWIEGCMFFYQYNKHEYLWVYVIINPDSIKYIPKEITYLEDNFFSVKRKYYTCDDAKKLTNILEDSIDINLFLKEKIDSIVVLPFDKIKYKKSNKRMIDYNKSILGVKEDCNN